MYAIIQTSGQQYKVQLGSRINVDRLQHAEGETVVLPDNAVFVKDDNGTTRVGDNAAKSTEVECEVIDHFRGPKLDAFKMKPKKRYRRHQGHRQDLTQLEIKDIRLQED